LEFDDKHQHVRCLAHVINLAAQQILITLKSTAANNEDDLLNNDNVQLDSLLQKVTDFLFNIIILLNFIKILYYFSVTNINN
jgi:hypothetical protein